MSAEKNNKTNQSPKEFLDELERKSQDAKDRIDDNVDFSGIVEIYVGDLDHLIRMAREGLKTEKFKELVEHYEIDVYDFVMKEMSEE